MGGPVSKKIFSVFWASVWSKNKGLGPFPGSTTGIVPYITYVSESNDSPLK